MLGLQTMATVEGKRKVCLLGLSGDPPTLGHQGMVDAILNMRFFDELRILPVYRHTYKDKRSRLTPYSQRIEMCRLAFRDSISDGRNGRILIDVFNDEEKSWQWTTRNLGAEEKSKTNVGTAALLDFLLEKEPENEFWLGLGADTYLDLTNGKWKESDRVLKHLGFRRMVIFHRDGRLSHEIVESRTPGAILLETISLPEVSSTVARSTSDESKLSQVISPAVIEYIKENRLYSFALDPP